MEQNSEYRVCIQTGLTQDYDNCVVFITKPIETMSPIEPTDDVITEPTGEASGSTEQDRTKAEILAGIIASSIFIIMCGLIGLVVRKRHLLAKHQKSELYSASGSGGEETSTWKYTTGNLTPNRSHNMTPESCQYGTYTDSPNIYAEIDQKYYPDALGHVTTRMTSSHGPTPPRNNNHMNYFPQQPVPPGLDRYEPAAHSTPQRTEPRSNRVSQPVFTPEQITQSLKFQQRLQRPAANYIPSNQMNNSHFY